MNVVIVNKLRDMLNNLNVPIGKTLIGQYNIEDIISSFVNFDYQKLIIDLSSIKDVDNLAGFQKLASSINMNNVIFLIDGNNNNDLITKLIPFGIYNFANSGENIANLITTPNTYKEVAHYHDLNNVVNKNVTMSSLGNVRVIGFKNMVKESGSTSLIYMAKQYLEKFYRVLAIEVDKDDFKYYKGENFISTSEKDFLTILNKAVDYDIVLIDINNSSVEIHCSDVLYLIEPSVLKISQLEKLNQNLSERLRGKKVVLNKSFLNSDDLSSFEYEGKIKVYFNLPPINDRSNKSEHLIALFKKLGIDKRNAKKLHHKK